MASDWPAGGSEMARRIREHDWAASPIGSVEGWPQALRCTVELMLAHGFPMAILWGRDLIQLYNDGYGLIVADGPSDGLGRPVAWHADAPNHAPVWAGEEPLTFEDEPFPVVRDKPRDEDARFTLTYSAIRDGVDVAGVLLTAFETTEAHRRGEERRQLQLLVAELRHRVRNILTVVRSVFGRTIEAGGALEDIADHFKGRLDSLARTQAVVTQSASGMVDLQNLIRDELLSVGANDGPNLVIGGPDVTLPPIEAESMGLAIHELTTNAVKYGALRNPAGRLDIRWTANMGYGEKRRLNLIWTEQGVSAVAVKPSRRGFGSELIEEALPYRLGAETKLEFRGGGVRCTISIPLPDQDELAVPAWKEI